MSKIGDFFAWMFVSALMAWMLSMLLSSEKCTVVYRSALPVVLIFDAAEIVSMNWTSPETKLSLLKYKANSALTIQSAFERTVYGDSLKCKK